MSWLPSIAFHHVYNYFKFVKKTDAKIKKQITIIYCIAREQKKYFINVSSKKSDTYPHFPQSPSEFEMRCTGSEKKILHQLFVEKHQHISTDFPISHQNFRCVAPGAKNILYQHFIGKH